MAERIVKMMSKKGNVRLVYTVLIILSYILAVTLIFWGIYSIMQGEQALGDKKGITRYGDIVLPMDETLILSAVDLSGRGYLGYGLEIPTEKVGSFDTELVEEFFLGFVRQCPMSLHIHKLAGTNSHHIVEGAFKSVARSLKAAVAIDEKNPDAIPSTKGVL